MLDGYTVTCDIIAIYSIYTINKSLNPTLHINLRTAKLLKAIDM